MLQNCAQSNCRIIPKKLRDMKREEICRLLADKVNKLKNKENSLSELLPDVRLLYGETPFARTPVMYEPGIIILFSGHKIGYINERVFRYDANEYLLLTVPLPFECETYATSEVPLAGINRFGNILFHGVYKGVHYAVSHLTRRQGVGINRIEHGKYRLNMGRMERLLIACGFTGDHRTGVGF